MVEKGDCDMYLYAILRESWRMCWALGPLIRLRHLEYVRSKSHQLITLEVYEMTGSAGRVASGRLSMHSGLHAVLQTLGWRHFVSIDNRVSALPATIDTLS